MNKQKIEPIVIAFFLQQDDIIVANPCTIPIDMMKEAIKNHEERKDKKLATNIASIMIPIPIKLGKKLGLKK